MLMRQFSKPRRQGQHQQRPRRQGHGNVQRFILNLALFASVINFSVGCNKTNAQKPPTTGVLSYTQAEQNADAQSAVATGQATTNDVAAAVGSTAGLNKSVAQARPSLFAKSALVCDGGGCSPSVAMLVARENPKEVATCAAFAVSDSIMATDDHCLPAHLTAGSACDGIAEVVFARSKDSKFSAEKRRCEKVLWRSGDGESERQLKTDLAYFTIERKLERPALSFDRSGMTKNQVVNVYKVDPPVSTKDFTGHLNTDTCRVFFGTSFFPFLDQPDSLSFILSGANPQDHLCHMIAGNSGSPVVDAHGGVKGLIRMALKDGGLDGEPNVALMSNSACLADIFNLSTPISEHCLLGQDEAQLRSLKSSDAEAKFQNEVNPKLQRVARAWGEQNGPEFRWRMASIDIDVGLGLHEMAYLPVPACSVAPRKLTSSLPPPSPVPPAHEVKNLPHFKLARFKYHFNLDQDLEARPVITQEEQAVEVELSFDAAAIAHGQETNVIMSKRDSSNHREVLYSQLVKSCLISQ